MIDRIFCTVVLWLLAGVVLALVAPEGAEWLSQLNAVEDFLLGIGVMFCYYVGGEGFFSGTTVGKLIPGTRVRTPDGGKATLGQIIGRTAERFIPFEPFSFLGSGPGGWHDSLSGTAVVDIRAKPLPLRPPATGAPRALPPQQPAYRRPRPPTPAQPTLPSPPPSME